jgi:NMD protein affecting ribosome stability and mRNA decay
MTHEPDLTYRGLNFCDGCGTPLEPDKRLSGLCPRCQPSRKPTPKTKVGSALDSFRV